MRGVIWRVRLQQVQYDRCLGGTDCSCQFTGAGKEDKLKFASMMFDEAGNGVITKAELIIILKANHMARKDAEVACEAEIIMAQANKEGDAIKSFDEFVLASKQFPNILFPSYDSSRTSGRMRY